MTKGKDLARLIQLAGMVLDQRLANLHEAATQRARSLARLDDLNQMPAEGLSVLEAAQAELRYNRWADARRAEINLTLARQTATWMEARAAAAQAFGRNEVLKSLHSRHTSGFDKS